MKGFHCSLLSLKRVFKIGRDILSILPFKSGLPLTTFLSCLNSGQPRLSHEPVSLKLLDSADIGQRPDTVWLTGGESELVGLIVKGVKGAVNPAKAERFFNSIS